MGLRDIIQAIRGYPAVHAELDVARFELRQAQQALEKSEQDRESLSLELSEQKDYTDFLSHKAEAFQDALEEFCPRLSTPEDMKWFYDTISPSMDAQGFTLYRVAKELTGIDVPSCFPYEDNRGLFEVMEGHQLMAYFDGSEAVNEKVVSLFPSVEVVDGELYGVAVCQISGTLSPDELAELKEYCHSQYNDAWGEGFAQRPRRTEYGDLYVSFYTDHSPSILTKEEMESMNAPSHPPHQPKRGGDAR